MDDALKKEVESRVRKLVELAWSAREERVAPTEEEQQAFLEQLPEAFREEIGDARWPILEPLSEEAKERYVRSETEKLFEVTRLRRASDGTVGPIDDDEWHEICMDRHDHDTEAMLTKLRERPSGEIRNALIALMEANKEDAAGLRSAVTDEQLSEISQKMVKRFEELTERIRRGEFRGGNEQA